MNNFTHNKRHWLYVVVIFLSCQVSVNAALAQKTPNEPSAPPLEGMVTPGAQANAQLVRCPHCRKNIVPRDGDNIGVELVCHHRVHLTCLEQLQNKHCPLCNESAIEQPIAVVTNQTTFEKFKQYLSNNKRMFKIIGSTLLVIGAAGCIYCALDGKNSSQNQSWLFQQEQTILQQVQSLLSDGWEKAQQYVQYFADAYGNNQFIIIFI